MVDQVAVSVPAADLACPMEQVMAPAAVASGEVASEVVPAREQALRFAVDLEAGSVVRQLQNPPALEVVAAALVAASEDLVPKLMNQGLLNSLSRHL